MELYTGMVIVARQHFTAVSIIELKHCVMSGKLRQIDLCHFKVLLWTGHTNPNNMNHKCGQIQGRDQAMYEQRYRTKSKRQKAGNKS